MGRREWVSLEIGQMRHKNCILGLDNVKFIRRTRASVR